MEPKEASKKTYFRYLAEQFEWRCRQRLKEDILGLNDEVVEMIMNLRRQLISAHARLREVEAELEIQRAGQSTRLARYRQVSYEAVWQDTIED